MRKLGLVYIAFLLCACGAHSQPTSAKINPTYPSATTEAPAFTTTVTETTTITLSETPKAPKPSIVIPEKRIPALSSSNENWVEEIAIFVFPDLVKKRGDLARGASSTRAHSLHCGDKVIDGLNVNAKPVIVWCGQLAKKFYFSEAALEPLRQHNEPAGQALIMQSIAAYSLDSNSMPGDFTPQQIAAEAGRLLGNMICKQDLSRSQVEKLAPSFGNQAGLYLAELKPCK